MPSRRSLLRGLAATSGASLVGATAWWVPRGDGKDRPPPDDSDAPPGLLLPPAPSPQGLGPGRHQGMGLAHLHRGDVGYGSPASAAQLRRLADLGVTHVALTPFAYQRSVTDAALRWGGSLDPSLTDAALLAEAAAARSIGLKITLKPHIWCRDFWMLGRSRQDIQPAADQGGWAAWFSSYRSFAAHYADLAQQMDAALYVVGLEYLKATEQNPGAWAEVAATCRSRYGGPLSYAANWWQEAEVFADWAAFDLIGINAYDPLSEAADPTDGQLERGWRRSLARYRKLSEKERKDVLFTEVGLRAVRGAAARPWESGQSGEADPALQARAYRALLAVATPQPWFKGLYWWKWFTDEAQREADPYCPMGQPAEAVLADWWGGSRGRG